MCEFRDEILLRGEECKTLENLKFSKSNIYIYIYIIIIIIIIINC